MFRCKYGKTATQQGIGRSYSKSNENRVLFIQARVRANVQI